MDIQSPQSSWLHRLATLLAAATLVLVIVNIAAERALRARQAEVLARQAYIDESVVLSRLNGQIIQLLATLSAETNDESIRGMLARHGITFSPKAKPSEPSAPPDEQ